MRYSTRVTLKFLLCLFLMSISISEGSGNATEVENRKLLLAANAILYKVDLRAAELTPLASESTVTAADYDFEKKLVVWTRTRSGMRGYIYRADGDTGDNKTYLELDEVHPGGIAVDWIYGNIYFTDTGTATINVISEDLKFRKLLFGTNVEIPRSIVVNPLEGWMFWIQSSKIERSGMDGTHRSTIFSEAIGWPNGLAIDLGSRRIYWADYTIETISSSDYDGSNVKIVLPSSSSLKHPYGLDVFEDWIYWTDYMYGRLQKANKITGGDTQTVVSNINHPTGIRVIDSSKQPKGRNYCQERAECSHLCLAAPRLTEDSRKTFTCACPNGMVLIDNQKKCSIPGARTTEQTTATGTAHSSTELPTHGIDETGVTSRIVGITSGILFGLIIVMSVVGFCMYKRHLRRPTINMENPVFEKQTEDLTIDSESTEESVVLTI